MKKLIGQKFVLRNLDHASETILFFKEDGLCDAWSIENNQYKILEDGSVEIQYRLGNRSIDTLVFNNELDTFYGKSNFGWLLEGFLKSKDDRKLKIFNVGLPRTGTTSLCKAIFLLGFSVKHSPLSLDVDTYSRYHFYDDTPIWVPSFIERIYKKFPKAKFIWTIRDLDLWLRSCRLFFKKKHISHCHLVDQFAYGEVFLNNVFPFNEESFSNGYIKHQIQIGRFFDDKQDQLLQIDITDSKLSNIDKWKKLCGFLGIEEIPLVEFPWVGASRKK